MQLCRVSRCRKTDDVETEVIEEEEEERGGRSILFLVLVVRSLPLSPSPPKINCNSGVESLSDWLCSGLPMGADHHQTPADQPAIVPLPARCQPEPGQPTNQPWTIITRPVNDPKRDPQSSAQYSHLQSSLGREEQATRYCTEVTAAIRVS